MVASEAGSLTKDDLDLEKASMNFFAPGSLNRRRFLRTTATAAIATRFTLLQPRAYGQAARAPSDTIRFAAIGTGTRGSQLLQYTLQIPGIECVGVSDLYDGRLVAAREYLKKDVPTTKEYRKLLDRKDIDAVIVAATDHQHAQIVLDCCAAGKDVYCEKPMSHKVDEGFQMIAAAQKHSRILQIGSQRVSSVLFAKAKEIYDSGRLGQVTAVEATMDRNSASGVWIYPIPADASAETIDWKTFLGDAPRRPFDAARFFRWRCFTDYGEGLGGDLFVHLISGIQFVTGINQPPLRAQATGGIFRWKDGRDFPDLLEALYDYPDFRVLVRCNGNNAADEATTFYGTKGTLTINGTSLTFKPQLTREGPETYSTIGWSAKERAQYLADYAAQHPTPAPLTTNPLENTGESFAVPQGYNDTLEHEARFFDAVRTRKAPVEDEIFGNNAAISCHLANYSYFKNTQAIWDARSRTIQG